MLREYLLKYLSQRSITYIIDHVSYRLGFIILTSTIKYYKHQSPPIINTNKLKNINKAYPSNNP